MKRQFVSSQRLLSVNSKAKDKKRQSNGKYIAANKNAKKLGDTKAYRETENDFKDTFLDAVMDIPLSQTKQISLHLHQSGDGTKFLNLGVWVKSKATGTFYCWKGYTFPLKHNGIQLAQRLQSLVRRYAPDEYAAAKEAVRISRLRSKA